MMLNSYIEWNTDVENIGLEIKAIQNHFMKVVIVTIVNIVSIDKVQHIYKYIQKYKRFKLLEGFNYLMYKLVYSGCIYKYT